MVESAAMRILTTACAIAYPVIAHVAVARGSTGWIVTAIALLGMTMLLPGLFAGRTLAWIFVPMIGLSCWLIARSPTPVMPLYIAPMLVPAFMAWVFGHTLAPGRTPLIAQFVRFMHRDHEEPEAAVWVYARRLTLAWTVLFIALASINVLLAMFAEPDGLLLAAGLRLPITVPQYWWSMFANLIGYLLVAAFFVIEYAYRRRRFPQQPYRNLFDFMKQMTAAMPVLLGRGR
jgi:uncharacterized membrane protein